MSHNLHDVPLGLLHDLAMGLDIPASRGEEINSELLRCRCSIWTERTASDCHLVAAAIFLLSIWSHCRLADHSCLNLNLLGGLLCCVFAVCLCDFLWATEGLGDAPPQSQAHFASTWAMLLNVYRVSSTAWAWQTIPQLEKGSRSRMGVQAINVRHRLLNHRRVHLACKHMHISHRDISNAPFLL